MSNIVRAKVERRYKIIGQLYSIADIEIDIYGRRRMAYKVMCHLPVESKDTANVELLMGVFVFYKYFRVGRRVKWKMAMAKQLFRLQLLEYEEQHDVLLKLKNRKATRNDNLKFEMLKYPS